LHHVVGAKLSAEKPLHRLLPGICPSLPVSESIGVKSPLLIFS
jgi:hypothetical protein